MIEKKQIFLQCLCRTLDQRKWDEMDFLARRLRELSQLDGAGPTAD